MAEKILLVVQRETSDPGRVGARLRAMGYELDIRVASRPDPLPATMAQHAGAVIFGGPMSANDDTTLPFIRAELEWIPVALDSGKPFLGICLGCQLLARALGAEVGPHPRGLHEIGFFSLHPTAAGRGLFEAPLHVYQWHGEGCALPAGAELLARGEMFVNQVFRYGEAAYGVQFHPEVTAEIVDRWTRFASHRLTMPGAQARDEQISRKGAYLPTISAWLEGFLEAWISGRATAAPAPAFPAYGSAAFSTIGKSGPGE